MEINRNFMLKVLAILIGISGVVLNLVERQFETAAWAAGFLWALMSFW